MRRLSLLVACGLVTATPALAQDAARPEPSCDGSTQQMVECLAAQTRQWDARLNAAYQQALRAAQPKQAEQLRAAQRLWIQYRDANCLYYALGEGTIARLDAGGCMLDMTRRRAEELAGRSRN